MKQLPLIVTRILLSSLLLSVLLATSPVIFSSHVHAAPHSLNDPCNDEMVAAVKIYYGPGQMNTFCAYGTGTYSDLHLTGVSDQVMPGPSGDIVLSGSYCAQLTVPKKGVLLLTIDGNMSSQEHIDAQDTITQVVVTPYYGRFAGCNPN